MIDESLPPEESLSVQTEQRRLTLLQRIESMCESAFIVFFLYALSIGPMYWNWAAAKYVQGSLLLAAFYEPLRILGEACPPLGRWLNWYVRLWIL